MLDAPDRDHSLEKLLQTRHQRCPFCRDADSLLAREGVIDTTLVNGVPLNVLRVCEWTWLCAPPPHRSDIHPNGDGHGAIAHSFAGALDA